jgi:hypothetical protein
MSLIQKIINLDLNNLKVQYLVSDKGSYSFLLSTTSGKIVSIGWQVADDFKEIRYHFFEKINGISRNEATAGLMHPDEWHKWTGELFLVNNHYIWHSSFNVLDPVGQIDSTLKQFIKNIKYNFPELRSAGDISDEEINKFSLEMEELQKANLSMSAEIERLRTREVKYREALSQLENRCNILEENNKASVDKISKLIKERSYFQKVHFENVLQNITSDQKTALRFIMKGTYIDGYGKEQLINQVEVNNDLLFPDLIIKIPSSFVENWDNSYDKYHFETYEYRRLSFDGTIGLLSVNEILQNPEAVFYSKAPYKYDDLGCCVMISKKDIV